MGWTERQRAMLREMGLRVWAPAQPAPPPAQPHHLPGDAAMLGAATQRVGVPAALARATRDDAGQVSSAEGVTELQAGAPANAERSAAARAAVSAPDERSARIAALGWNDLRTAVAECTACGLCQGRRQTVFGVGHPRAHWMIVGEAPGEQEDLKGEPFVGAAGQLLDNMLRALSLSRADGPPEHQVYIANTLKCRPPRNRNPEADELAQCEPFLVRQIQLVRPRLILAMGRFAVHSLLNTSDPIGKLRGRVHRYQGVPLVVTYHPAYLLRNLADKARAWDDLCLAALTVDQTLEAPAAP